MNTELNDGGRVAVVGGGPAGAMFSYFMLKFAGLLGIDITVDIYEPRDFKAIGPAGCNMCGGIISESLIQSLAAEGIRLPEHVIQRGIDSYTLHTDNGSVEIQTPYQEQRIATVHRGGGPRDMERRTWGGFDEFLMDLATSKGANHLKDRVSGIERADGTMTVKTRKDEREYDLVVGATGVNSAAWKLYENVVEGVSRPKLTRAYLTEAKLGRETVEELFGSSLHIFLLDIPRLDFAAIVPKGDYATIALLGNDIDSELLDKFFASPEVKGVFPGIENLGEGECHCQPRMNIGAAKVPYSDRFVMVGDSGVSRLNKDGIGAAYRTAKAAAVTAAFHGISSQDFASRYAPTYKTISRDNGYGAFMFGFVHKARSFQPLINGIVGMARREQTNQKTSMPMSLALWDLFTGSAPYRDIFYRMASPRFAARLGFESVRSVFSRSDNLKQKVS